MTKRIFLPLLAAIMVLTSHPISSAQTASTNQQPAQEAERAWLRTKSIAPGAGLIIEPKTGDSFRGVFLSASDDKLSLLIKGKSFDIDRSLIRRLYGVKERSRSKSALTGAGLGLAAGVGIGVVVVAASDKTKGVNLAPVSLGFLGTLAGAAIGALKGGKRKGQLLYESK